MAQLKVKSTVQNAINLNKPWKQVMYEFLAVYRATPHATTGIAPSVLLHGRHIRTRLNIVGLKTNQKPHVELEESVHSKQRKYKQYADKKRSVKVFEFNVGDWVRIKKPGIIVKGDTSYSKPVRIAKKVSRRTYQTEDGKRWNINKLVKARLTQDTNPDDVITDFEINEYPEETTSTEVSVEPRKSSRQRRPPVWTKDYVIH